MCLHSQGNPLWTPVSDGVVSGTINIVEPYDQQYDRSKEVRGRFHTKGPKWYVGDPIVCVFPTVKNQDKLKLK